LLAYHFVDPRAVGEVVDRALFKRLVARRRFVACGHGYFLWRTRADHQSQYSRYRWVLLFYRKFVYLFGSRARDAELYVPTLLLGVALPSQEAAAMIPKFPRSI
jgi:hypothetical protein